MDKHVELKAADLWTRVRFSPPPPFFIYLLSIIPVRRKRRTIFRGFYMMFFHDVGQFIISPRDIF